MKLQSYSDKISIELVCINRVCNVIAFIKRESHTNLWLLVWREWAILTYNYGESYTAYNLECCTDIQLIGISGTDMQLSVQL